LPGRQRPAGRGAGRYASTERDLVATAVSPLEDVEALRRVTFVMKDGTVYKDEGSKPLQP
jgi:imidazolonepropionase-like amidohydrolase